VYNNYTKRSITFTEYQITN